MLPAVQVELPPVPWALQDFAVAAGGVLVHRRGEQRAGHRAPADRSGNVRTVVTPGPDGRPDAEQPDLEAADGDQQPAPARNVVELRDLVRGHSAWSAGRDHDEALAGAGDRGGRPAGGGSCNPYRSAAVPAMMRERTSRSRRRNSSCGLSLSQCG